MNWKKLTLSIGYRSLADKEWINFRLFEMGAQGIEELSDDQWSVFFPPTQETDEITNLLLEEFGSSILMVWEIQKEEDWLHKWKEKIEPVLIEDRFYIRAPWHAVSEQLPEIIIEPNLAFGTGHHESTRLILKVMRREDILNRSVLDLGCGSAILAIAAFHFQAAAIVGLDNDLEALSYAESNLEVNRITNRIQLYGDADAIPGQSFDVVLMNMISSEQFQVWPLIERFQPGVLYTSGILDTEMQEYQHEIEQRGFVISDQVSENEWRGFRLIPAMHHR